MKKKIFSILFALVLVLTFSLVTAVPVAAQATLYVPSTLYPTIQAAVNAANPAGGDTIIVASGTYDEQVVISKSLTLQGAGDTTVIQPSGAGILTHIVTVPWLLGGTKKFASIIVVNGVGTAGVTIKDLKVDGANINSAPTGSNWVAGIVYNESAGIIDDATVVNMETPTLNPRTNGIWLSAATTTVLVEVKNSTVNNYNRGGIYALGSTLTVNIHDNTVTGPGALHAQVPNGIMLLNGTKGTIGPSNTVTNHMYTPPTYAATGIALWDISDVIIQGNNVTNCELGIALTGFTGSTNNIVQGNTLNNNPRAGVYLEMPGTSNNTISSNYFTNNGYGIEFMGPGAPTYDPGEEAGPGNVLHSNNIDSSSSHGICLREGASSSIHHNTATNNGGDGINVAADGCSIHHNTATGNTGFGIHLTSTSDLNIVHHNTLSGNAGTPQIWDESGNNKVFRNKVSS